MRLIVRLLALASFLLVLCLSLGLHHVTGGRLFTQLPSEALAKMRDAKGADDSFAGLGMDDLAGKSAPVDNEFRFGLLPAGPGHYLTDSASVLTFAGPAFVLLVAAWWSTRRRR